mmetsp:Transcript_1204/g.4067  ORF Transcript_1204/g.4067 Transcript_1204/m.4067 type:complete len:201 (+) Transcript_1204:960-1562(+)
MAPQTLRRLPPAPHPRLPPRPQGRRTRPAQQEPFAAHQAPPQARPRHRAPRTARPRGPPPPLDRRATQGRRRRDRRRSRGTSAAKKEPRRRRQRCFFGRRRPRGRRPRLGKSPLRDDHRPVPRDPRQHHRTDQRRRREGPLSGPRPPPRDPLDALREACQAQPLPQRRRRGRQRHLRHRRRRRRLDGLRHLGRGETGERA